MHRRTVAGALALLMSAALTPSANAQSADNEVALTFAVAAEFRLDGPDRRIIIQGVGTARGFLLVLPTPAVLYGPVGMELAEGIYVPDPVDMEGCVELYRGGKLRDRGCGEYELFVDPTLSAGSLVGQVPSDDGMITSAVSFAGGDSFTEPAPVTTLPPLTSVLVSFGRSATAVGFVQNDLGEGMVEGEVGQTENAYLSETVKIQSYVLV